MTGGKPGTFGPFTVRPQRQQSAQRLQQPSHVHDHHRDACPRQISVWKPGRHGIVGDGITSDRTPDYLGTVLDARKL